jgi:hypothetical protein
MSARIFSRPTPSRYPTKPNRVRKRPSAPRSARGSASLLGSIDPSREHRKFVREPRILEDMQFGLKQDGGKL